MAAHHSGYGGDRLGDDETISRADDLICGLRRTLINGHRLGLVFLRADQYQRDSLGAGARSAGARSVWHATAMRMAWPAVQAILYSMAAGEADEEMQRTGRAERV